jgi:hypothetical protein
LVTSELRSWSPFIAGVLTPWIAAELFPAGEEEGSGIAGALSTEPVPGMGTELWGTGGIALIAMIYLNFLSS